jgi:DNA-binding transcriptional ArsR family regulator
MSKEGFNEARAELFEALGHPMRVRILESLEQRAMGFAEIKKAVGIESSGHLQFHLRKLDGLINEENGSYSLTDDGKEALRVFRTGTERLTSNGKSRRFRRIGSRRKVAAIVAILVVILVLSSFIATGGVFYTFQNQLSNSAQSSYTPGSWYTISFNETANKWVNFGIALGGLPVINQSQQIIPIQIVLSHAQGIDLESLKLEFMRTSIGCCWVFDSVDFGGVEGYPPPNSRLYSPSIGDTTIDLSNFGFVGTGTVNIFLDLYMDRASTQPLAQNGNGSIGLLIVMQLEDSNHLFTVNSFYGNAYILMTPQPDGLLTIIRTST